MRDLVSQKEMHERALSAFRQRIDVGLRNALANTALEPPNPFQPEEKRRPARGFVLALLIGGVVIGSFVYFNFLS
jgi:hypothetical protein